MVYKKYESEKMSHINNIQYTYSETFTSMLTNAQAKELVFCQYLNTAELKLI